MTWNPTADYAQPAERLPIEAPPCSGCRNWHPVRQFDARGGFIGVRLCQAEEMWVDFSCFKAREDFDDAVASAKSSIRALATAETQLRQKLGVEAE